MEEKCVANRAIKLRLFPTKKQAELMRKNMEVSRAVYNWARGYSLQEYQKYDEAKSAFVETLSAGLTENKRKEIIKEWCKENKKNYISSANKIRKVFTQLKKSSFAWTNVYDAYAGHETIRWNFDKAIQKFNRDYGKRADEIIKLRKKKPNKVFRYPQDYGYPQYKLPSEATSYRTQLKSYSKIDREAHKIFLPKIGYVRLSSNQEIPDTTPLGDISPVIAISTDNNDFYVSIPYYAPFESIKGILQMLLE